MRTRPPREHTRVDRRNLTTQMCDPGTQQRVGQKTHAVQLDQDRGVTQEHDTVRGLSCTTHNRAIGHGREPTNEMTAATDQSIRRQHGHSLRILGFAIRALILLGTDAFALVVITALLSATDALSFRAAVVVAATMALINAVLWPLITRLALALP